ncbi:MAG: AAA family ATPase [Gaiellaceae bacterium]
MERKLATVLFVDLVGSTALVAAQDPEVVRRRLTRYFESAKRGIEQHGGLVEKFAGDAVMAVFGMPQAHEDDAERAVRAGFALLDAVHELELEVRVGMESGEILVDEDDSTFATGEAVNVAARLQQAAEPGQILLGPGAQRLAGGRIEAEELGPLELKGLAEAVWAWRAVGLRGDGAVPPASIQAPLIGRDFELDLLENTYERAIKQRRAHIVTIYGEPGVGKSRLAREFAATLERTTVVAGRCLPYGEGVTYWPLAEMVKTAAGIADDDPLDVAVEKLRAFCEDEAIADLIGLATGLLEAVRGERSQQEIAWAARGWAQRLARDQPLVLVFEDIHWAEESLLDLIEHLASWVRDAPLLIICLARPELLDVKPSWGGGMARATAIELEPLTPEDSGALVSALAADGALSDEVRAALLEKTEGNPLFVEETVRMFLECEGRPLSEFAAEIPDTLQALIGARIDRLPAKQKTLLQRASVVGRIFWEGAVAHLAPECGELEPLLQDLIVRELVAEEPRSSISGERAYRFKHILIREVAFRGLTKSMRADLHLRFAEWLAERAGEELLEIRAYHLDHAAALLAELDGAPPQDLAEQAAEALEEAGRRALAREANQSARRLLLRAVELEPTLERRYQAARAAWRLTDIPTVSVEMGRVLEEARDADDRRLEGRALIALAEVAVYRDADPRAARELAEQALSVLDEDDEMGRYDALEKLTLVSWWEGNMSRAEEIVNEKLEIARRLKRKDLEVGALAELAAVYLSRLELDRAEPLILRAHELAVESGSIGARAYAARVTGELADERGDMDEAERAYEEAASLYSEIGVALQAARTENFLAMIALKKGDLARAEKLLREAIRTLKPLGDRGVLVESQRMLAQVLLEKGSLDEAERLALESRETVGATDVTSRATTRLALALVRAEQSRPEEAETLLREAVEILEGTDSLRHLREPLEALTVFLRDQGRTQEAELYERRLAELTPAPAERSAARIA